MRVCTGQEQCKASVNGEGPLTGWRGLETGRERICRLDNVPEQEIMQ